MTHWHTLRLALGLAGLLLGGHLLWAQAPPQPFITDAADQRVNGTTLEVDVDGTLRLASAGVTRTFRPGQYRAAWIPKPQEVSQIEAAFAAKRFNEVPEMVDRVYPRLRWVGYGGLLSVLKGKSFIERAQFRDAEQAFAIGVRDEKLSATIQAELRTGVVQALIGQENFDAAERQLASLGTSDERTAPYIYKARGYLAEKRGKRKEAVLEYLKVVLLYTNPPAAQVRRECLERVAALLREDRDVRAEIFEKMLKEGA